MANEFTATTTGSRPVPHPFGATNSSVRAGGLRVVVGAVSTASQSGGNLRYLMNKLLPILVLLCCVFCARAAVAQSTPTVAEIAKELSCDCPDCGRQAVDQCMNTCETGKKYAAEIAVHLKQGKNKREILNHFADTYGEHILGNPRPRGIGRMAPIMPFLALLCGLVPVAVLLRKRKLTQAQRPLSEVSGTPASDAAKAGDARQDDPRLAKALDDFDY